MIKEHRIKLNIPKTFYGNRYDCNYTHVRWKDHINDTIFLEYNDMTFPIAVDDVINGSITFSANLRSVKITVASMSRNLRHQREHGYCNAGKLFYLIDPNTLLGETGHNALLTFKYKIGEHIKTDNLDIVLTDIFTKRDSSNVLRKFYKMHCNNCGWDGEIAETSINKDCRCSCCSNYVVVPGINDIATTDQWAVTYFVNKDDCNMYHSGSFSKVDMICPICKQIHKDVTIRSFFLNTYHLNCCGYTYKSYPERFVMNFLSQLYIRVIPQVNKDVLAWVGKYRYDFYLPSYNCIIETHGSQHYTNTFFNLNGETCENVQKNDYDKELLAINNVSNYIVLDCRTSNRQWVHDSIMKSNLPTILGFNDSDIDWELCDRNSRTDMQNDICKFYNEHIDKSLTDIANYFGLSLQVIRDVVHIGADLGICEYNSLSIREKLNSHLTHGMYFAYKDGKLAHAFTSSLEIYKNSKEILGIDISSEHKIVTASERHFDIFGYVFVRNQQISSYIDYIEFMLNTDNHFIPSDYVVERSKGMGFKTYAYYDNDLIGEYDSRNDLVRDLRNRYDVLIPKNIAKYVDSDKICCEHFTFKTDPAIKERLVKRGRRQIIV
jgi:hypothetical protein